MTLKQQGRCMQDTQPNQQPEQTLFWCPPLTQKTQSLTFLWQSIKPAFTVDEAVGFAKQVNRPLANSEQQRAEQLLASWPSWQVSRYNSYRPATDLPSDFTLVITDPGGSLMLGAMLSRALLYCQQHNLNHILVVSDTNGAICPKALAAIPSLPANITIKWLTEPCHHASLLAAAAAVVVYNSWLGFEALLWQKPVLVLGSPFYAGMGLTQDTSNSVVKVSLPQLVYSVLFERAASACPETRQEIAIEQALTWLHQQNQQRWRFAEHIYAIGFSYFWKPVVQSFFQGSKVHFVKNATQVPAATTAVVWGRKVIDNLPSGIKLYRLEDGFLRSVGLGALFTKPLSWVADSQGLYFDATTASDLELLLSQQRFSLNQLEQAQQLRHWLSQHRVSKYNTGTVPWQRPRTNKKIILVTGQVETDASLTFGAPGLKKNIELLQNVRHKNPNAYIIYKPHPDVLAGARALGENEQQAHKYCDEQAENVDISTMLEQVDEVHVITSLAGFEALLRGKKVVCYGLPFYAGWGLTEDSEHCARRNRRLTLDELVAGSLICYPLYISKQSGFYSTALATAKALTQWRADPKQQTTFWQRILRKCLNLIRGKH